MRRFIAIGLTAAIAAVLCACGTAVTENAALLNQPLRRTDARIKIVRASEFVAGLRGARVKLDGKEIANLDGGGSIVLDVAAGSHEVMVDVWDHPNVYPGESGERFTRQRG